MGNTFSFVPAEKPANTSSYKHPTHVICFGYFFRDANKNVDLNTLIINSLMNENIVDTHIQTNLSAIQWSSATSINNGTNSAFQVLSFSASKHFLEKKQKIIPLIEKHFDKNTLSFEICFFEEIITPHVFHAKKNSEGFVYSYLLPCDLLTSLDSFHFKTLEKIVYPEFLGHNLDFHNYDNRHSNGFLFSIKHSEIFSIENQNFIIFSFHGKFISADQVLRIMTMIVSFSCGKISIDSVRSSLSHDLWDIKPFPKSCLWLDSVDFTSYSTKMLTRPSTIVDYDSDVTFRSRHPVIQRWKHEHLFPFINKEIQDKDLKSFCQTISVIDPPKFISPPIHFIPTKQAA